MERFQKIISVYSYGLGCGLYNRNQVIKLCDDLIETKDNVPIEIIETSLMAKSKIEDIEHTLMSAIHQLDIEKMASYILGLLYKRLTLEGFSVEYVIKCTSKILLHTGLCHDSKFYSLYSIEDSYNLCIKGVFFQLDDICQELHSELENYEIYEQEFNNLLWTK